jgi:phage shock protein E
MNKIIVDVRSIEEWEYDGHAPCSINIPLDRFPEKVEELKKYDSIVLVCRSGGRAGVAQSLLRNAGYANPIENLGPWQNVNCAIA